MIITDNNEIDIESIRNEIQTQKYLIDAVIDELCKQLDIIDYDKISALIEVCNERQQQTILSINTHLGD